MMKLVLLTKCLVLKRNHPHKNEQKMLHSPIFKVECENDLTNGFFTVCHYGQFVCFLSFFLLQIYYFIYHVLTYKCTISMKVTCANLFKIRMLFKNIFCSFLRSCEYRSYCFSSSITVSA